MPTLDPPGEVTGSEENADDLEEEAGELAQGPRRSYRLREKSNSLPCCSAQVHFGN